MRFKPLTIGRFFLIKIQIHSIKTNQLKFTGNLNAIKLLITNMLLDL